MPVTIVKPQVAGAVTEENIVISREEVDAYADLSRKIAKRLETIAPLQKELAAIEAHFLKTVDIVAYPSEKFVLSGEKNEVLLSAQGQRTSITDMERAADLLGEELFLKLAKVTIKDLNAYLTPDQLSEVTAVAYATKRRVKIEKL